MDDYWKGYIAEIREYCLPGLKPEQLVHVLWFYTKAHILEEMENGRDDVGDNSDGETSGFVEDDDIKRWCDEFLLFFSIPIHAGS
jgi:hypothetical protein